MKQPTRWKPVSQLLTFKKTIVIGSRVADLMENIPFPCTSFEDKGLVDVPLRHIRFRKHIRPSFLLKARTNDVINCWPISREFDATRAILGSSEMRNLLSAREP